MVFPLFLSVTYLERKPKPITSQKTNSVTTIVGVFIFRKYSFSQPYQVSLYEWTLCSFKYYNLT